jgi:hypothetical protein
MSSRIVLDDIHGIKVFVSYLDSCRNRPSGTQDVRVKHITSSTTWHSWPEWRGCHFPPSVESQVIIVSASRTQSFQRLHVRSLDEHCVLGDLRKKGQRGRVGSKCFFASRGPGIRVLTLFRETSHDVLVLSSDEIDGAITQNGHRTGFGFGWPGPSEKISH